jgi:hypothetical protein
LSPGDLGTNVLILADDLIWQTRLAATIRSLGASATTAGSEAQFVRALPGAGAVIVDLTATRYRPIDAIESAVRAGHRVLALGQHDDAPLRKRALDAGAERVFAYRKLFEDGPRTLGAWLAVGGPELSGSAGDVREPDAHAVER